MSEAPNTIIRIYIGCYCHAEIAQKGRFISPHPAQLQTWQCIAFAGLAIKNVLKQANLDLVSF